MYFSQIDKICKNTFQFFFHKNVRRCRVWSLFNNATRTGTGTEMSVLNKTGTGTGTAGLAWTRTGTEPDSQMMEPQVSIGGTAWMSVE